MAQSQAPVRPSAPRGRPRDATRGAELLHAAQDLLLEVGYEHLSMDAVAKRAGASKSTLYRRWPSKADLVSAALEAFEWDAPVPDTGSLRDDLMALAQVWFDPDEGRDRLFVRLWTAIPGDEQLRQVYLTQLVRPRAAVLAAIVRRAAQRGEVPTFTDPSSVGGILPALAFQHLVVLRQPIDATFLDHVLDDIILPLLRGAPAEQPQG